MTKIKTLKNRADLKRLFIKATFNFILCLSVCSCQLGKTPGAIEFEQRYIEQMYMLGCQYLDRIEETDNYKSAISYLTQAAKRNHPLAQYKLGALYLYLEKQATIDDDNVQAFCWFKRAAEQGVVSAQYKLGVMYKKGQGTVTNDKKAFVWLKQAADQGHVEAQYNLGVMYCCENENVRKDISNAIIYFEKAELQGHATAPYALGLIYQQGKDIIPNIGKAIAYFEQAAAKGCVEAQLKLGTMYYEGKEVKRNRRCAIGYLKQAAEEGCVKAQFCLGQIYCLDVELYDYNKAIQYFTWASQQGDIESSFYLGEMYQYGLGIKANQATAIKYYTEAAKKGEVNAQYSLGMLYLNRERVRGEIKCESRGLKNLERAYKWLIAAADQGDEDAWKASFELRLYFLRGKIEF
ncbi:MAG: tetratricopeptide repeat protein [Candidatus Amoebophilus sp.]